MTHIKALLVASAAVLATATACGSSPSPAARLASQVQKFDQCMRDHGSTETASPDGNFASRPIPWVTAQVQVNGGATAQVVQVGSGDPAFDACGSFLPNAGQAPQPTP